MGIRIEYNFDIKKGEIMRVVERFNKENGIWEEFEFKKLIIGDIFRFFDDSNNVWIATGIPFLMIYGQLIHYINSKCNFGLNI